MCVTGTVSAQPDQNANPELQGRLGARMARIARTASPLVTPGSRHGRGRVRRTTARDASGRLLLGCCAVWVSASGAAPVGHIH